jgi:hypothetical protein
MAEAGWERPVNGSEFLHIISHRDPDVNVGAKTAARSRPVNGPRDALPREVQVVTFDWHFGVPAEKKFITA